MGPTPPTLHVIQTSADRIQLHWKTDDSGSAATSSSGRGFLLHWRHPDDGGDWLERELDPVTSSVQLDVTALDAPLILLYKLLFQLFKLKLLR